MKKCYVQNLEMIVTNNCNLDCKHCLRGKKNNDCMSFDVIKATLEQVCYIGVLNIGGGEPILALEQMEKIISFIIDNKILLDYFTVTINGTIYSEEFLKLLDKINNYHIEHVSFAISLDDYHVEELEKRNLREAFIENAKKYQESKYFFGFRDIDYKLFREGNAVNLDKKLTTPLKLLKPVLTYIGEKDFDRENGICNIGPMIVVNPYGTLTECNASIEHQETIYNYGNVLTSSIEESCIQMGSRILTPKRFQKVTEKELKKYLQ